LAKVLEEAGPVLKHDLEPSEISEPVTVMHICFPYYDAEQFKNAASSYIRRFDPRLVVINSTVVPGTTRDLALTSGAAVAYSPVRGKHVKMPEDLKRYTKFVSALEPRISKLVEKHFQTAGIRTATVERPETLELAKLAETTYFGLQIT